MANFKVTKDQDQLDKIVFNHYGNLLMFDEISAINPHLSSIVLNKGDIVNLPIFKPKQVKEQLW